MRAKKPTYQSFTTMRKQVEDGRALIAPLLNILKKKIKSDGSNEDNGLILGEKDSLLSAYMRLSQIQIKWVELSLSLEKEQARQREWQVKNLADNADGNNETRELSLEEWGILEEAIEQHKKDSD